jgi:ABC-type uncharacterized transport system permease subunit
MAVVLETGSGLLPLLYLALLIDYGATFFLRTRTHVRSPWLGAVIAVHAALLVLRAVHAGHPPVAATPEILSLLALATAAVYAYVEFVHRDRRTGVFVILLAFVFQYVSTILLAGRGAAWVEPSPPAWSRLHVLPALVAYTAMAFAGIYGLLYLLAQRSLRLHRFGVFFDRMPPLDLLAPMTWHALVTGFVFMTVAICSAPLMFGGGEAALTAKVISKIVTGSVAWLVCAAAVLGRWLGKWPASRIAAVAVAGFLVVMALLAASGLLS